MADISPETVDYILEKLYTLGPNKVIDVSSLEPNGIGIRIINRPGFRSGLKGSYNLPIVSNNIGTYARVVRAIAPEYEGDINMVRAQLEEFQNMPRERIVPGMPMIVEPFRTVQTPLSPGRGSMGSLPQVQMPLSPGRGSMGSVPQVPRVQVPSPQLPSFEGIQPLGSLFQQVPRVQMPLSPGRASMVFDQGFSSENRNMGEMIANRLNSLNPGQLLDVTNMDSNGRGTRIVWGPTNERSNKMVANYLPITSSNPDKYRLAVDSLGTLYRGQNEQISRIQGNQQQIQVPELGSGIKWFTGNAKL